MKMLKDNVNRRKNSYKPQKSRAPARYSQVMIELSTSYQLFVDNLWKFICPQIGKMISYKQNLIRQELFRQLIIENIRVSVIFYLT